MVAVGASLLIAITVTSNAFGVDADGLLPFAISALTAFTSGVVFQKDCSKSVFFCCALTNKVATKAKEIKRFFFIKFLSRFLLIEDVCLFDLLI